MTTHAFGRDILTNASTADRFLHRPAHCSELLWTDFADAGAQCVARNDLQLLSVENAVVGEAIGMRPAEHVRPSATPSATAPRRVSKQRAQVARR